MILSAADCWTISLTIQSGLRFEFLLTQLPIIFLTWDTRVVEPQNVCDKQLRRCVTSVGELMLLLIHRWIIYWTLLLTMTSKIITWNCFMGKESRNFGEHLVLPSGIIGKDKSYIFFHWWIKNLLCLPDIEVFLPPASEGWGR